MLLVHGKFDSETFVNMQNPAQQVHACPRPCNAQTVTPKGFQAWTGETESGEQQPPREHAGMSYERHSRGAVAP